MEKVSRKQAITLLRIFDLEKMSISGKAKYVSEFLDACEMGSKAMEKLQKIEALYEPQEFGKGISREERDREVQKILKE